MIYLAQGCRGDTVMPLFVCYMKTIPKFSYLSHLIIHHDNTVVLQGKIPITWKSRVRAELRPLVLSNGISPPKWHPERAPSSPNNMSSTSIEAFALFCPLLRFLSIISQHHA